jgi:hypothetical protein
MQFDPEGHLKISPEQVFQLANDDPRRLIDHYLTHGTPVVFPTYDSYYFFLREVSNRLEVHPRNIILRGSAKLGFSIAPKVGKVWVEVGRGSDLDLAIVDASYYERIDQTVIRWEERNRAHWAAGRAAEGFAERQRDRFFNCCRIKDLPRHLFPHHFDAMEDIARMEHCGRKRDLNAFIFRDWWALRSRFEFDLGELREKIPRPLPAPPPKPFRRADAVAPQATSPTAPPSPSTSSPHAGPSPSVTPTTPPEA